MKRIIALIGVFCLCAALYAGAITYGDGKFVVCTSQGKIFTSPDGTLWKESASPVAVDIHSIAYGNGKFVAITRPVESAILISPDGMSWTKRASGINDRSIMYKVKFVNGRFIILSDRIMESADGVNWNIKPGNKACYDIIYINGKYVVCGFNWVGISTSLTGFSLRSVSDSTHSLLSIAYGNGKYVVCGGGCIVVNSSGIQGIRDILMYSSDAQNWKTAKKDTGYLSQRIIFDGTKFIANAGTKLLVSTDGINWEDKNLPHGADAVYSANGITVILCENNKIYTSTDLNNWTAR